MRLHHFCQIMSQCICV